MSQRLRFLVVMVLLVLTPAAWAQVSEEQALLDDWAMALSAADSALERESLTGSALDVLQDSVAQVLRQARVFNNELQPRIDEVRERLASITPADGGGSAEETGGVRADRIAAPEALARVREELEAELEVLISYGRQADLVILRAGQILDKVAQRRGSQFSETILARDASALSPTLLASLATETPEVFLGAGAIIGKWGQLVAERSDVTTVALIVLAIAIIAAILFGRAVFLRWAEGPASDDPTPAQKVVMALAIVVVDVGVPFLILVGLRALLSELGLLPRRFGDILDGLTAAVAVFTVITGFVRALVAPKRPAWRIAGIANLTARRIYNLVLAAAVILAVYTLIAHLALVTDSPPFYAIGLGGVMSIPIAILTLVATRVLVNGRSALTTEERLRSARWRILTPIAGLAALITIVAAVAGYLAFARFMVEQMAWVWVVIGGLVLSNSLANMCIAALSADRPAGRRVAQGLGISDRALGQTSIVFAGIVKLILAFVALLLVIAPWGFDSSSILSRLQGLYYGIQVGSIRITFSTILTAALIFLAIAAATRVFQRWLKDRFLPTTAIEPGLKNSISITAGYLGVILAVALAATYAGFDLASIALVAGALSVGIGFGLQSIVNNFVSGLILLAERPIRAGDWIEVGTDQGTVRRISVRATEIETFDRASVIVPNSNLISGVVTNRYLRGNIGRITIPVGVSYGSDPEQVRKILLACANGHELVLDDPPAFVLFTDFGASSLDFELRCYLSDISFGLVTRSDLRFAILAALREAGIEIPFPQRDIHLRDLPEIERVVRDGAGAKPDAGSTLG